MADRLTRLLDRIGRDRHPPIGPDEIQLLLAWLNGSTRRGSGTAVPEPAEDPVVLKQVYHQLDRVLFESGELAPGPAGLADHAGIDVQRTRIRRLASAFHPDRFPELEDWLTVRSQAVHRAYAAFKQDPDAWRAHNRCADTAVEASARRPGAASPVPRPTAIDRLQMARDRLRRRFGRDRWLAHKLIAGIAVLALLPVINLVLAPLPPGSHSSNQALQSISPAARPAERERQPADYSRESASSAVAEILPSPGSKAPPPDHAGTGSIAAGPLPSVDEQLRQLGLHSDNAAATSATQRSPRATPASIRLKSDRTAVTEAPAGGSSPHAPAKPGIERGTSTIDGLAVSRAVENPVSAGQGAKPARHEIPAPVDPAESSGAALELGPIATHAVGRTLTAWHDSLEAGKAASLLSQFEAGARIHRAGGGSERAERYFQTLLQTGQPLRVDLRVLKVQRQRDLWRVEASIVIAFDSDLRPERQTRRPWASGAPQRATLWMREHGPRLLISRIEQHSQ